jgi:hypothetical protein
MRKYFIAIAAAMSLFTASAEVTYMYDESTKTLTFSGEGEMNVYTTDVFGDTYVDPEWSSLKDEVEKVVINEGVTNVGKHAFLSFSKLKDVKIASTVEIIDVAAFEECTALTEITLPEGLKEFGEEAFYGCSSLTSISIPKNVTYLPGYIFQGCESLKHIDLGNVREFGAQAFQYCGFETFEIPEGTKTLSENMFFSCRNIKYIEVPASVEVVESGAFYYCEMDTIKFLGDTFPTLTGYNNFTLDKKGGEVVISVNCNAYTEETVEAIKSHGGAYDTKIIPTLPSGTEIYSTDNMYGTLTITPVDCEKNLYKLSVDLLSSSCMVTWEGTYDVPESDLHKTEIVVDLSTAATVIAKIEVSNIKITTDVYGKGTVKVEQLSSSDDDATFKLTAVPDEGYKFSRWKPWGSGVSLTDEQMTNPEIEVVATKSTYIDAYFVIDDTSGVNYCGKDGGMNATWRVENDMLIISGEGEMEDYSIYEDTPFYFEDFSYIYVGEGITNVGEAAFANLYEVKEIYLPTTITAVEIDAFAFDEKLEKVYFAGSIPPTFNNLSYTFEEIFETVVIVVPCEAVEDYSRAMPGMKVVCEDRSGVKDLAEVDVIVMATDGRISVNRDEFRVYDIFGRDVTSSNGSLTSGIYILKCDGKTLKCLLK